jgi:hypothetical protein
MCDESECQPRPTRWEGVASTNCGTRAARPSPGRLASHLGPAARHGGLRQSVAAEASQAMLGPRKATPLFVIRGSEMRTTGSVSASARRP